MEKKAEETHHANESYLGDDLEKQQIDDDGLETTSVSQEQHQETNQPQDKPKRVFFSILEPSSVCSGLLDPFFYALFILKPHGFQSICIQSFFATSLIMIELGLRIWRKLTKRGIVKHSLTCVLMTVFIMKLIVIIMAIIPYAKNVPWYELFEKTQSLLKI